MKVLMVNYVFSPEGGAEVMLMSTANLLKKHNIDVEFFAKQKGPYLIEDYKYKYFFPKIQTGKLNYLKNPIAYYYNIDVQNKLKEMIEEIKPDLIHLHVINSFTYSIFECFKDIPTVLTFHSVYWFCCPIANATDKNDKICLKCSGGKFFPCITNRCANNSLEKSIRRALFAYISYKNFKNVDYFITPSNALKDYVIKSNVGINSSNVITIPNFLPNNEFNTIPNYTNKAYFVYSGRLVKIKGVHYLLEAMKELPKDIELHIVGTGSEEETLKDYAKKHNLDNVKFLGFKTGEELKEEYQNCIAVIVPSNWFEIFGMVNIEAFINGKPVIASNIGGIPEIVEHNKNGLLFEPGNVEQLKECILKYWNNPELVVEHGKNGYQKAKKEYREDSHYEKLIKVYEKALNKYNHK